MTSSEAFPVFLATDVTKDAVTIKVIGASDRALIAEYEVEAFGGPRNGSNKSVQRSVVRLKAEEAVTLMSLKLGIANDDPWGAILRVKLTNGANYEQKAGSE